MVYSWVYQVVSGCNRGVAAVVSREESTGWQRATSPLQNIEVRGLDAPDTPSLHPRIHPRYTQNTTGRIHSRHIPELLVSGNSRVPPALLRSRS